MKKFICGILIGSICTISIGSLASGVWDNIDVLKNDIKVVVNGDEVTDDNFVYEDTTYLPIRAVSTALGEKVEYDEQTNTAYIGERNDDLNNDEIKSRYNILDNLNPDDMLQIRVYNGNYYISRYAIKELLSIPVKEATEPQSEELIFILKDGTEKRIRWIIFNDQEFIPYDTFMDEIYPYIK